MAQDHYFLLLKDLAVILDAVNLRNQQLIEKQSKEFKKNMELTPIYR